MVAAGRRTFTFFPPDQLGNLYIGPLETAPGGLPVSLARLDAPNFSAHPRFREALEAAVQIEAGPGDAVYIPYGWWHHVRATAPVNMLVNYWWNEAEPLIDGPFAALLMGLLTLRDLPDEQRAVWKDWFDRFVFLTDGDPMGHVPPDQQGALGGLDPRQREESVRSLLDVLGPAIGLNPPPRR